MTLTLGWLRIAIQVRAPAREELPELLPLERHRRLEQYLKERAAQLDHLRLNHNFPPS